MRKMKSSEIDQPLYQKDMVADLSIVGGHSEEKQVDDEEHINELNGTAHSQATSAYPPGKINFGNVGFVKFVDEAEESSNSDLNENSEEMDDQDYVRNPVLEDDGVPTQVDAEAVLDPVQEDVINTVQEDMPNTVHEDMPNPVQEDVLNTVQEDMPNPSQEDLLNLEHILLNNPVQENEVDIVEVADTDADQVQGNIQEVENNSTPNRKRNNKDSGPNDAPKKKKKQSKPIKEVRKDIVKKAKDQGAKSDENAKKGFKSNFITIKLKLSTVHLKAGTTPDFALFVKDNVHSPDAVPPSQHAGKYLAYINGNLTKHFFSRGISYDPDNFYICQNEVDLKEDRQLPFKYNTVHIEAPEEEDNAKSDSSVSEEDSEVEEISDDDVNIFDMSAHAKRVSWGAPERENSESSQSSGGVLVHGRGAQKEVSTEKKTKRTSNKKRAKDSTAKTKNDILGVAGSSKDPGVAGPSGVIRGKGNGRGRGRGRGRGGKKSKK